MPTPENCKTIFEEDEKAEVLWRECRKGSETPENVVKARMDSEEYRENLLQEGAKYLGELGRIEMESSAESSYLPQ